MLDEIAVLIPCYNEEKTIEKVITDCKTYLPDAKIYVYDNNSTDKSVNIAFSNGAIVRHEYKQGKGNVVRAMFKDVDAKCYLLVDADDTYSLKNAKEMCNYVLNENFDMVIGDRLSSTYFTENKRKFHNFGNKLVLNIINKFFKTDIKDVMTGFRCMSYEFVKTFPILTKGFEIETEMTIHTIYHNLNIKNIIVDYKDRPKDSPSKLNTFEDGFKVINEILNLYKNYKPLQFFTFFAIILSIIATIFFIPVLIEFTKTSKVDKFPTLITCGYVYIAAILTFFVGLILSTIAENEKKHFEQNYINAKTTKNILLKG
ncbi:MAG: glycosyltransferase [Lachnospiraceae bacterium]|nr:glycosyltransferase [Lachnospiraceae bacterium]